MDTHTALPNVYEYTFEDIRDYHDFSYNYYLDYTEVVLKPIVNQYHTAPSHLQVSQSPHEIKVSGQIFSHEITVIYRIDEIQITYHHHFYRMWRGYWVKEHTGYVTKYSEDHRIIGCGPVVDRKGYLPPHLPPVEGTPDATLIFHIRIPVICGYVWNLWRDYLLPFDPLVDRFAIYIRAFYIDSGRQNQDDRSPNPLIRTPDQTIECNERVIDRIHCYAPNEPGSIFDPLSSHRTLTAACLRWKVYQPVRAYNLCMAELSCLPVLGREYCQARDDFASKTHYAS